MGASQAFQMFSDEIGSTRFFGWDSQNYVLPTPQICLLRFWSSFYSSDVQTLGEMTGQNNILGLVMSWTDDMSWTQGKELREPMEVMVSQPGETLQNWWPPNHYVMNAFIDLITYLLSFIMWRLTTPFCMSPTTMLIYRDPTVNQWTVIEVAFNNFQLLMDVQEDDG